MADFGLKQMLLIAILIGALMVLVFIASIFLPIINLGVGTVGDAIDTGIQGTKGLIDRPQANDSQILTNSVALAENSVAQFSHFPYILLVGSIIFFFVIAVNIKVHPSLIIVWFAVMFVIILVSIPLSNSYTYVSNSSPQIYGSQNALVQLYNEQLPIIFTIFGLVGGIFLFIIVQREPEFEVAPLQ